MREREREKRGRERESKDGKRERAKRGREEKQKSNSRVLFILKILINKKHVSYSLVLERFLK